MDQERTRSFPELRGATRDTRPPHKKPYKATSYAAQYGVPVEDIQVVLDSGRLQTHGEIVDWITKEYLTDPYFRERAMDLQTRPFDEKQAPPPPPPDFDLIGPITDPEFERPLTILGRSDMDFQRKFFGCEEMSWDDIDDLVRVEIALPHNHWMHKVPRDQKRIYAMSCENLRRQDPDKYRELYGVEGKAWENYG